MRRYYITAALILAAWMCLEKNILLALTLLAMAGLVLPKRNA